MQILVDNMDAFLHNLRKKKTLLGPKIQREKDRQIGWHKQNYEWGKIHKKENITNFRKYYKL